MSWMKSKVWEDWEVLKVNDQLFESIKKLSKY